jgi:sialic acid synthase SpsE
MQKIKIADKIIGDDYPCFTIAEAGANHEGEIKKAFKLIDEAKRSGVDAIKFQTYTAEKLTTRTAPKYWDDGIKNETQFDVFNKLDKLTNEDWKKIFDYAGEKKIICFSTPFDESAVDLLDSFDVPAFKIASADITHIPLIKKIASKRKPIFLSTGMASIAETHEAVSAIESEGNNQIVIMHCITSYPTKPEDANLEMISLLKEEFPNHVIGYSDHTLGTDIAVFSTFYGSKCIEKHFTHDKNLSTSRDHRLSLNADDFKELIGKLKLAKMAHGSKVRNNFSAEVESIKYARRSIVSSTKITRGTKITRDLLEIKRPGTGIQPKFLEQVIGKIASCDIEEDIPITWNDLE